MSIGLERDVLEFALSRRDDLDCLISGSTLGELPTGDEAGSAAYDSRFNNNNLWRGILETVRRSLGPGIRPGGWPVVSNNRAMTLATRRSKVKRLPLRRECRRWSSRCPAFKRSAGMPGRKNRRRSQGSSTCWSRRSRIGLRRRGATHAIQADRVNRPKSQGVSALVRTESQLRLETET